MIGWDKNATKVTNVASRDRLMVASYEGFTIVPPSMVIIVCVMFVVAVTPVATISLLLLLSNLPSQSLKHTYLQKLANNENSNIHKGL